MPEVQIPPPVQPGLTIEGLYLTEPSVALTSVLLAGFCFYAWRQLAVNGPKHEVGRWHSRFFGWMALSTFFGGLGGHAFLAYLNFWTGKVPGWWLGMAAMTALGQAAVIHARTWLRPGWSHFWQWLNWGQLLAFSALLIFGRMFFVVGVQAAFVMLCVVAPLEGFVLRRSGDAASRLILWSIAPAVLAGVVAGAKWSPGLWFTHLDLGHVFMGISFWILLQGARQTTLPTP